MADKKISELDAISGSATASDDLFLIVDSSGSVTKKISREELNNAIEQDVLSTVDINGGTIDSTVIGGTTPAAGDFTTLGATGNITVGGTVDGRDVATDGSKLDGIAASATANPNAIDNVVDDTTPQLGGNLDLNNFNITGTGDIPSANLTGALPAIDGSALTGIASTSDVVNDTTPQLGGNLDLNSNDITGTGNIDVTGTVTADYNITLEGASGGVNYKANSRAFFGSLYSSHFAMLGSAAKADETANSQMIATETSTGNGLPSAVQFGAGNIDFHTIASSTANAAFDNKRMRIDKNGDISFYDSTGTTQGLFWDASTQRLGLGSTTPVQKLDVYGGNIAVSSADTYQTAVNIDNTDTGGRHFGLHSTGSNSTAGRFRIYDYDANAERMTIDSSGNVSLGNGKFLQFKDSGGTARDVLTIDAFNGLNINSAGGGSAAPIVFKENGSEVARFDSSGNLLIGKTSDTYNTAGSVIRASGMIRATVSGDAAAQFNRLTNNGTLLNFSRSGSTVGSVSVTTSGTTYNTTSDLRLKTDIEPIADATDRLMAMNAVTHKWKADPDAGAVVGFIAQEMKEIVPEAVSGSADSDEMMSMDYGRITPVLVAALQDAHKKIEQLEQRIADMENS